MNDVNLNMDFTKSVVIDAAALDWTPSPQPGVERQRLARENVEKSGHATSIVRYAPGSSFPRHVHGGGEEYLVLDGTFSDETGDFPRGFYVRNPPGSSHAPFTREGCTIFVKLWQMAARGETAAVVDSRGRRWIPGRVDGHAVIDLFAGRHETVTLKRLAAGTVLSADDGHGGEEILVLDDGLVANGQRLGAMSWLRSPASASAP